MKKFKQLFCIMLSLFLILSICGCTGGAFSGDDIYLVSSSYFMGQAKGYYVDTDNESAIFKTAQSTLSEQQENIDKCLDFGKNHNFNTAFVDVHNENGSIYKSKYINLDKRIPTDDNNYDMLKYMCTKAQERSMQIYAVLDLYNLNIINPEKVNISDIVNNQNVYDPQNQKTLGIIKDILTELLSNYDISGIVLKNIDVPFNAFNVSSEKAKEIITNIVEHIEKKKATTSICLLFDFDNKESIFNKKFIENLNKNLNIDMFIPTTQNKINTGYIDFVNNVVNLNLGDTSIYTINEYSSDNANELQNQLLANATHSAFEGSIIGTYTELKDLDDINMTMIKSGFNAGSFNPLKVDLSIQPKLNITYPENNFVTDKDTVFIMGTSAPDKPITINGEEYKQTTTNGTFGIHYKLNSGENIIKISQDNTTCELSVNYTKNATQKITAIPDNALFPTTSIGYDSNETVNITITAPAQSTITATVRETTVLLKQTQTAAEGMPVEYTGSFSLNNVKVGKDEVKSLGKITYIVASNGNNSVQTSKGEIVVAGRNIPLVAEVLPHSSALLDSANVDKHNGFINKGAKFAVRGKTPITVNGYKQYAYKLSNNQYIQASNANIESVPEECYSKITAAKTHAVDKNQVITFIGATPAITGDLKEKSLELTFFDSDIQINTDDIISGIVTEAKLEDKGRLDILTLTFNTDIWGYDVSYKDGNTEIFIKTPPSIDITQEKPLSGIKIVLDAGHGGKNPGAMGVAGTMGPTEAMLNDAYVAVTRFRLEQMGAKVITTRGILAEDVSLDERMDILSNEKADIFLSLHHNSTDKSKDLTDVSGMEVYYNTPNSKLFADTLMKNLSSSTMSKSSESQYANYFVTRTNICPAVLFELGYIVNPTEYEKITKEENLYKVANAVSLSILEILK